MSTPVPPDDLRGPLSELIRQIKETPPPEDAVHRALARARARHRHRRQVEPARLGIPALIALTSLVATIVLCFLLFHAVEQTSSRQGQVPQSPALKQEADVPKDKARKPQKKPSVPDEEGSLRPLRGRTNAEARMTKEAPMTNDQ
jgi:hypothetical protein